MDIFNYLETKESEHGKIVSTNQIEAIEYIFEDGYKEIVDKRFFTWGINES